MEEAAEAGCGPRGTPRGGEGATAESGRTIRYKATTHAARAQSVSVGAKIGSSRVVDTHMIRVLQTIGSFGIAAAAIFFSYQSVQPISSPINQTAAVAQSPIPSADEPSTTTPQIEAVVDPAVEEKPQKSPDIALESKVVEQEPSAPTIAPESQNTAATGQISRIQNPYPFQAKAASALDQEARAALVNIHCISSGSPLNSASGSGVIIDPRGIILTNAHVAQYMLLATRSEFGLSCSIRHGSPARNRWKADILYLPSEWVGEHAKDIAVERPKGTGEHDYALLVITESVDSTPLPPIFPYLEPDVREAIAFPSDSVLLAAFPAEFCGSFIQSDLYASSVFTKIGDLLTFDEDTVDLVSLGGIVLAQSGSSGGATVNMWGRLVGVIVTTSEGATTAMRNLRAMTLSYINRDIQEKTGQSLSEFISDNPSGKAKSFMTTTAPDLAQAIVDEI